MAAATDRPMLRQTPPPRTMPDCRPQPEPSPDQSGGKRYRDAALAKIGLHQLAAGTIIVRQLCRIEDGLLQAFRLHRRLEGSNMQVDIGIVGLKRLINAAGGFCDCRFAHDQNSGVGAPGDGRTYDLTLSWGKPPASMGDGRMARKRGVSAIDKTALRQHLLLQRGDQKAIC